MTKNRKNRILLVFIQVREGYFIRERILRMCAPRNSNTGSGFVRSGVCENWICEKSNKKKLFVRSAFCEKCICEKWLS